MNWINPSHISSPTHILSIIWKLCYRPLVGTLLSFITAHFLCLLLGRNQKATRKISLVLICARLLYTFNIENSLKLNDNYGGVVWVWPSPYVHVFELLGLTSGTVLEDCGTLGGSQSLEEGFEAAETDPACYPLSPFWMRPQCVQSPRSLATMPSMS